MMSRAPRIDAAPGSGPCSRRRGRPHTRDTRARSACRHAGRRCAPSAACALPVIQTPGCRLPPSCLPGAERPAVDELVGDVVVAPCAAVEQIVADRHRHRRAEQRESRHALADGAPRASSAGERTRASGRPAPRARRRAASSSATSQSAIASTRRRRLARRAAVAGQVDGEHVAAVVREIARLQRPQRCGRSRRRARTRRSAARASNARAPGVRVDVVTADDDASRIRPCPRRSSARLRSSIRSSASSRPTDSRIVPSVMPALGEIRRPTSGNASSTPDG